MKSWLLVLLIIGYFQTEGNKKPISVFKTDAKFIASDKQGNIYLISDFEIKKVDSKGKLESQFSTLQNGMIGSVDASNPYRVLVYYPEQMIALELDNRLGERESEVNLVELGFPYGSLICRSYNNSFLFFNFLNNELSRVNQNMETELTTENLEQVIGKEITPTILREIGNRIILIDPETGILLFDIYGTYLKTLPFKNITSVQAIGSKIYFIADSKIMHYDEISLQVDTLNYASQVDDFYVGNNQLLILANQHLSIFE